MKKGSVKFIPQESFKHFKLRCPFVTHLRVISLAVQKKEGLEKKSQKYKFLKQHLPFFQIIHRMRCPTKCFGMSIFQELWILQPFGGECSWEQCISIPLKISTDLALLKSVKLQQFLKLFDHRTLLISNLLQLILLRITFAGEMAQWVIKEHSMVFQKIRVQFPAFTSSSSQPPVTPAKSNVSGH